MLAQGIHNACLSNSHFIKASCVGTLNCIRALGGYTTATSAETAFDTETFSESEYMARMERDPRIKASRVSMNWYNALKVVGLFCIGFVDEAAKLGFFVYETRHSNPK